MSQVLKVILQHSVRMFVGTFKSQQAGAIVMYDGSNSTSTGQVFNFIHYWKNGLKFGLNFILPIAELKKERKKNKRQITHNVACNFINFTY